MFKGQLKPLSILIMIIIIGCLMLVINTNSKKTAYIDQNPAESKNDIQLYAEDVFQIQYDINGNKKIEIQSNTFTEFKSGLKNFTAPKFYLYKTTNETGTHLNWKISANHAEIKDGHTLYLQENVEGNQINAKLFKFTTPWLNYDLDNNLATSNAEILIWQANNTASATGFDMDLNTNKIDIQLHNNVVFHFLDEAK